jgi:ADP-heptose:LPS heptosyltransferase
MKTLIIKLGATGDVVRTTTLLHRLNGEITWITADKNLPLLVGLDRPLRPLSWENRKLGQDTQYDLVINLEDTVEIAQFVKSLNSSRIFGACLDGNESMAYSEDSREWFDLSLISRYGRTQADKLKFLNRSSYQDLVFRGLGFEFSGEEYMLPQAGSTGLVGDVAISREAGPVWPMKNWAFYDQLKAELKDRGYKVNVLRKRPTLLEHLADVAGHRCLVGGDSLPMHFALGTGTPCVSLFTCTSPWEIYGYGIQTQIISPLLGKFFYRRGFDARATTAIRLDEALAAVLVRLESAVPC